MLEPIAQAAHYLIEPSYWGALFAAVGLATMASVVPGVNSFLVMAMSISIIIFNVDDPAIGIVLLATITGVDNTLDSIPAVLYGQPGAATQVTFLEGHQLARKGRAAYTLGAVYSVSALGGLVGAAALIIAIPIIRPFILKFRFSEIAATGFVGLAMITILSRGAIMKGAIAAVLGMLIGLMGTAPTTGVHRLTIGPLFAPALVPTVLGLFALPEMIDLTISRQPVAPEGARISVGEVYAGAREGLRHWKMVIRQSLFGVAMGAIPGVGSAVIDWLAYAFGVFLSKDKSQFGTGSLEGVIFAESAQNAKEGGQAIPTLAMGVPGGPTWVLVMGGMIAYGIAPGPEMVGHNAHITILLVFTLALGNLLITAMGLLITSPLAKLTTIPYPVIGAIIIPVTLLSAFIDTTSWRGIQAMLAMGAVGLVMKHFGWPRPPMLLAFILSPIIEQNLHDALSVYGLKGTITDPLPLSIVGGALVMAFFFIRAMRRMDREEEQAEAMLEQEIGVEPVAVPARDWRTWRWDYAVHLGIIVITVLWIWDAKDYPRGIGRFPIGLCVTALLLTVYHLVTVVLRGEKPRAIMDLGMTSAGIEGAARAARRVGLLLVVFVMVGITLHLAYAALALAVLVPINLLKGPGRYWVAAITGLVVFLFITIVIDNILHTIWPVPFVTGWDLPWGVRLPFSII